MLTFFILFVPSSEELVQLQINPRTSKNLKNNLMYKNLHNNEINTSFPSINAKIEGRFELKIFNGKLVNEKSWEA